MPTLLPSGALRARRVSSAASRLPGITSPRFALHGWQRTSAMWHGHRRVPPNRVIHHSAMEKPKAQRVEKVTEKVISLDDDEWEEF
ncbi:MAG: hypothetical protein RPU32_06215 [Candidatus Sedimenticola sp. (ex Thyasira tokunagai)]